MTKAQKRRGGERVARLGRSDPEAVEKDVQELVKVGLGKVSEATLCTDDHRADSRALRGIAYRVPREITSAKERRAARNPRFEIHLLDLLIRIF